MAQRHYRGKMMKKLSASISDLLSMQRRSQHGSSTCCEPTEGSSGLHHATQMGNVTMLKMLLQNKVQPIDAEDAKGRTPLHYAVALSSTDAASLLLSHGACSDAVDCNGTTPMHIACEDGMLDAVNLLFYYRADVCAVNSAGKTPFDVACEFGRFKTVKLLLDSGVPTKFLMQAHPTTATVKHQRHAISGFHLAARQGHLQVLTLLLEYGWPIDRLLPAGTALHEAAANGRLEVVRFLIHAGAEVDVPNVDGHTPLDLAKKSAHKSPISAKEIRYLLKEWKQFVYGRVVAEFAGASSDELTVSHGDIIWIIEREDSKRWKGVIFGHKFDSRSGFFPPSAVEIVDKPAVAMSRSSSHRQVKKVGVPIVPDMPSPSPMLPRDGSASCVLPRGRCGTSSYGSMEALSTQNSPAHRVVYGYPSHQNGNTLNGIAENPRSTTPSNGNRSPQHHSTGGPQIVGQPSTQASSSSTLFQQHLQQRIASPDCQRAAGVAVSPRHRNSTGSNSSQASSGFESMKSSTQASVATNHTLRGDSPPSRNSVHSSSSGGSLGSGSMERLDEGTYTPVSQLNVVDLVMNGVPDADVLAAWLHDLRFEEYLQLFLSQGYDVPTVARMTPEDLTAIGITKPGHRKRLTTEIHRWRVTDSWPTVPPAGGLREWLRAIGLPEYVPLFETQGYSQLKEVLQLTWEDFEDIGITRLGHLKKLGLAIKKLKDHRLGVASAQQPSSGEMMLINVPNGRTTVEVKPYSHQPSNGLNTFQQTSASPSHLMHPAAAPSTDAYGTFPRRNGHAHNLIMTEAIVHDGGRPMVEVRPVSKMSSQEVLSHDYDDWLHEDSPKKHSLFAVASSSSYANANLHGDLDLPEQKKSIRLNLHSPGRILSDGRPPLAPKRQSSVPPPAPSSQQRLDSSGDSDDYPPPPAPIACEGPIRRLRSVISVGGNPAVLDSMPLPDSSRSSTSSTEALPFANENCGTIRSRNDGVARSASTTNATLGSSSSSRRSARDVFADPGANMVDSRRPQNGLDGNGDVLNDIGHMLQNLTDELDALLCPAVSRT